MKRLYTLTLTACALVSLCSAAVDTDKLEEAIEQSEISRVKSLFKKLEREEMTPVARKKLFGNLYDTAAEVTERRASSISLFGNWRDMTRTGLGCLCGVLGACLIIGGLEEHDYSIENGRLVGSGVTLLAIAAPYNLYKGITCSTQKNGVAQAKLVEKFLKSKLNNVDTETVSSE